MPRADRRHEEQALDWVLRIQDPYFADWEGHAAWLNADPRHLVAFDRVALLVDLASGDLLSADAPGGPFPGIAANDNPPPAAPVRQAGRPRRAAWAAAGAGAIASGIAALLVITPALRGGETDVIRTRAGERRAVTLGDGTRMVLNGDTAVTLTRTAPRSVTLDAGEAFFVVAHDAARPFRVRAGTVVLEDVGTAFDVARARDATEIAVREGAVAFDPDGAAVRLASGDAARVAGGVATMRSVDPGSVGGWRDGRLAFRDTALIDVADSIGRSIGAPVAVDARVAARRFSGVVRIEPNRARMFRRFGAVADVAVHRDGAGWRVAPADR